MPSLALPQPPQGETGRLLSADTVLEWLRGRGLLSTHTATAEILSGGVSSVVIAVRGPGTEWVVKQPRARLAVEQEWLANPERARNEAKALDYVATLLPGSSPALIAFDESIMAFVMAAAPQPASNWKSDLLAGTIELSVAGRVGTFLGRLHALSGRDDSCRTLFDDRLIFQQLRIEPYYHTLLERHPALRRPIESLLDRMLSTRTALVHGDFTPKNILVVADGIWVLDWEIAHFGDPVFDVASVLAHLSLKAIHRPGDASSYVKAARRLLAHYEQEMAGLDSRYLAQHMACFMLARVDGKSPAEYLTPAQQNWTRGLAATILGDGDATFVSLLGRIECTTR